jgi:hypothetical protein
MQNLLFIAIFVGFILFASHLNSKVDQKLKVTQEKPLDKSCPPHKWRYEDQPGVEGVSFIRCQICKKTPSEIV